MNAEVRKTGVREKALWQTVIAFIRKDVYAECLHRPALAAYCALLVIGFILVASFPEHPLASTTAMPDISPAAQLFNSLSLTTPFFLPLMVYLYGIQGEKRYGSFVLYRILPIELKHLFIGRVVACWLLGMIPFLVSGGAFLALLAIGKIQPDVLTPAILDFRFVLLVATVTLFTSTLAVGIGLNISPQMLPAVVMLLGSLLVLFPFIFSRRILGIDSQVILVELGRTVSTRLRLSALLVVLSLILGSLFYWGFRRKRSYL